MGFAMRERASKSRPTLLDPGGRQPVVGLDLGTCCSRVAIWQDGDVTIIPNERGSRCTPTCVAFTKEAVYVGNDAHDRAAENVGNVIYAPQRLVGGSRDNPWVMWYARTWPSRVDFNDDDQPLIKVDSIDMDKWMLPEEILTLFLVHLRRCAEEYLDMTVTDVVVTVPSKYGRCQREGILEACVAARLNVLDFVKAPTASALAYNLTNQQPMRKNMLVCNMGGTYFDFALICVENGHIKERAVGTDFVDLDTVLARFCMRDLWEKYSVSIDDNPAARYQLRAACEQAKIKLSQHQQACISVSGLTEGVDYTCHISRPHFEAICLDEIQSVLEPIAYVLSELDLPKESIDDIVLVGGLARLPLLRRHVKDFFLGKAPREVLRPDHAAVLGAAVYAAMCGAGMQSGARKHAPEKLRHLKLTQVNSWEARGEESDSSSSHGRHDVGEETSSVDSMSEAIPDPSHFRDIPRNMEGPSPRQMTQLEDTNGCQL